MSEQANEAPGGSAAHPTAEELAAVLAALRLRAAGPGPAADPLTAWRHRRLAALGQTPRRGPGQRMFPV